MSWAFGSTLAPFGSSVGGWAGADRARITAPTLLVIGMEDRTVVGKALLSDEDKKKYGQYPALALKTKEQMTNAVLVELPGIGHIPHIQDPSQFQQILLTFTR